jgi:hypothetical protein
MKNIIHHVRSQPEHIRQLTAVGCTIIVGSLVVAFWLHSFQTTTFALLNPGQEDTTQSQMFAVSSDSLFGNIGNFFSEIKAQIGGLFGGSNTVKTQVQIQAPLNGPIHPLPVSNDR